MFHEILYAALSSQKLSHGLSNSWALVWMGCMHTLHDFVHAIIAVHHWFRWELTNLTKQCFNVPVHCSNTCMINP